MGGTCSIKFLSEYLKGGHLEESGQECVAGLVCVGLDLLAGSR
jgi:hypothetical protein